MYDQTKHPATNDDDRTVLALLLDPGVRGLWSVEELAHEIGSPHVTAEVLSRLFATGQVHRCGKFVFPTRAARRADNSEATRSGPTNADLGHAIRRLRRARRVTIQDLANEADMHPTYLSGIERGVRNPTWAKLCGLAQALHIAPVTIIRAAEGSGHECATR